jgi:hypothetical protein
MDLEVSIDMLVSGADFESCQNRVLRFFDRTMLVRFDEVTVDGNGSLNGTEQSFFIRVDEGISANRKVIGELVENLQEEGYGALEELPNMEAGYLTKILHTIAHLLDGFIGIDSRFFNLAEDSHSISNELRKEIEGEPQKFWILRVKGKIASASEDPFDALRTFERQAWDS